MTKGNISYHVFTSTVGKNSPMARYDRYREKGFGEGTGGGKSGHCVYKSKKGTSKQHRSGHPQGERHVL